MMQSRTERTRELGWTEKETWGERELRLNTGRILFRKGHAGCSYYNKQGSHIKNDRRRYKLSMNILVLYLSDSGKGSGRVVDRGRGVGWSG